MPIEPSSAEREKVREMQAAYAAALDRCDYDLASHLLNKARLPQVEATLAALRAKIAAYERAHEVD